MPGELMNQTQAMAIPRISIREPPGMDSVFKKYLARGLAPKDAFELLRLSNGDITKFDRLARRRAVFGEPLAYIRGSVEFMGRTFKVDKRVYVPNPETQRLTRLVIGDLSKNSVVGDIGTGSGCIAISIKLEKPEVTVFGADIDPSSLKVAKANARAHGAKIRFYESSYADTLFNSVKPTHIVADMPYGTPDFTYLLGSIDVRDFAHMPQQALYHPDGTLKAYEELIDSIRNRGWNCRVFFETGVVPKEEVRAIIPKGLAWEYRKFSGYSVTIVQT